ncbi:BSD domain-containing protein 1-like isoform X2 [Gordionus sp. m RMFG-2023]|uniref:BSD domain-containing protein 1-like isoform X2 n=1 Tax=Gordionus sp. m RMFG-2023 TaxID=3053472 RepID=UPI0031FDD0E2
MNYLSCLKTLTDKVKPTFESVRTDLNEIKEYILPISNHTNNYIQDTTNFAKKHILNNIYESSRVLKEGIDTIWNAHIDSTAGDNKNSIWDKKKVPNKVNDTDFWKKYDYKVHLLEEDEKMRQSLLLRASTSLKDDLAWDGNEDDWEITSSLISTPEIISPDQEHSVNNSNITLIEDEIEGDDNNIVKIDKLLEIHNSAFAKNAATKSTKSAIENLSSSNKLEPLNIDIKEGKNSTPLNKNKAKKKDSSHAD